MHELHRILVAQHYIEYVKGNFYVNYVAQPSQLTKRIHAGHDNTGRYDKSKTSSDGNEPHKVQRHRRGAAEDEHGGFFALYKSGAKPYPHSKIDETFQFGFPKSRMVQSQSRHCRI